MTEISASEAHQIVAQLEVSGCTAELYLNGIPLRRITPDLVQISNAAAASYLVAGDSVLELLVEPGSRPTMARFEERDLPFAPMTASARLIRFPVGAPGLKRFGEVLAEANFEWAAAPPDQQRFPQSVTTRVTLGGGPRWSWQDAEVLTQSDALVDEACAVLDAMEAALRAGSVDQVYKLSELSVADNVKAFDALNEAEARRDLGRRMTFVRTMSDPVRKRDRDQHDFRLVANGRMLQIVDRDYAPSFALHHHKLPGETEPYRMMLGRVNGELRILR